MWMNARVRAEVIEEANVLLVRGKPWSRPRSPLVRTTGMSNQPGDRS